MSTFNAVGCMYLFDVWFYNQYRRTWRRHFTICIFVRLIKERMKRLGLVPCIGGNILATEELGRPKCK
jgi:hypothetical protein